MQGESSSCSWFNRSFQFRHKTPKLGPRFRMVLSDIATFNICIHSLSSTYVHILIHSYIAYNKLAAFPPHQSWCLKSCAPDLNSATSHCLIFLRALLETWQPVRTTVTDPASVLQSTTAGGPDFTWRVAFFCTQISRMDQTTWTCRTRQGQLWAVVWS